jgi:integrase
MDAGTPTRALTRAAIKAGLVDDKGRPLVTFHGLRHTAASIMLAHGVPLIVVSRQLGHVNPQVTAEVYAHLLNDSQLDVAAGAFEELGMDATMGETLGERRPIP